MAKLGQIYNLDSFDSAKNYFKSLDSNGGTVLARNLEHISSEVFEQRIAGLSFLTASGIVINNEGGYAKAITKLKSNIQGDFKDAGDNTNGKGKISMGVEDDTMPVFMKEAVSDWSETELNRASLENRNLVSEYLRGHDQKYKEQIDKIGYLGIEGKSKGLLNNTLFASSGATGVFSGLTAQEMFDEVATLVQDQRTAVLNDEMFSADRVAVHPDTYNILSKTYVNTAGSLTTVREALERTLNITFVITSKCDISGVKRIVAYSSQRQAIQMRIPVALKISNQYQIGGFRYGIESMFAVAGCDLIESLSGKILTAV
jgi:hypothetical protein